MTKLKARHTFLFVRRLISSVMHHDGAVEIQLEVEVEVLWSHAQAACMRTHTASVSSGEDS